MRPRVLVVSTTASILFAAALKAIGGLDVAWLWVLSPAWLCACFLLGAAVGSRIRPTTIRHKQSDQGTF